MSASEEARVGFIRAYVRVSTDEQAQEGHSLQAQRDEIMRLVAYKWPDARVTWYEDDGWSAKDTKRPALQRLRNDVETGDIVVALRLDRLTRSVFDLYTMLTEWDRRSIRFRSVREDYDTSTSAGKFMIGLLALLAQWERERIAERVREVMANVVARDRRHVSKPPLGYDLVDKSLVVNEKEAALVRRIFAQYLAGQGTRAIALSLNAEGLRTKSGSEWTDFGVSYVLSNPVYTGKVTWGRVVLHGRRHKGGQAGAGAVVVDGAHPPLIDGDTWAAAQELKGRRRKSGRAATGQYPLSGIAQCGLCGGPMHGFLQRRYRNGQALPGKERAYYRCSNRNHKEACKLPYLPADDLESRVLTTLGPPGDQATLNALVREFLETTGTGADTQDRGAQLQAELKRLERRRQRYDTLYEDGEISRQEWRARISEVRLKQEESRAQLADLAPAPSPAIDADAVARALAELPLVWQALTPPERKVVLHGLVGEVVVHEQGQVLVTPRVLTVPGSRA